MTWQCIGKIKSAQGLKGEVFSLVFAKESSWLSELQTVLLVPLKDSKNTKEIFESSEGQIKILTSKRVHKEGLVLGFKDITDRTQAESFKNFLVAIPSDLLVAEAGENIYLQEILHFSVFDQKQVIGQIQKFSSNGAQDLLVVMDGKKEMEIPFVEAFVEKIDYANKEIHMHLPPGLLELNDKSVEASST